MVLDFYSTIRIIGLFLLSLSLLSASSSLACDQWGRVIRQSLDPIKHCWLTRVNVWPDRMGLLRSLKSEEWLSRSLRWGKSPHSTLSHFWHSWVFEVDFGVLTRRQTRLHLLVCIVCVFWICDALGFVEGGLWSWLDFGRALVSGMGISDNQLLCLCGFVGLWVVLGSSLLGAITCMEHWIWYHRGWKLDY